MKRIIAVAAALALGLALSAQTRWLDPLQNGGGVQGQGWSELNQTYFRLPDRAEEVVPGSVWGLSRQSAGLNLVFMTDAKTLTVKFKVKGGLAMYHMPSTGVSGIDLYAVDRDGNKRWCSPRFTATLSKEGCEYVYDNITMFPESGCQYEYHMYLGLYNGVESLEIGVPEDAQISFCPSSIEKPLVVYGTSIAQGACASRPGNCWTGILDRELDHPVVNLGFSGSGRLEPEVVGMIGEIDAAMFIIDCLPNLADPQYNVTDLVYNAVAQLRESHDCPILLVEHSGYMGEDANLQLSRHRPANSQQRKAYNDLLADGFKNIYYLTHEEIGLGMDGMVEGVHPNDLGMRRQADAVEKKVKEILRENTVAYQPCIQNRDMTAPSWTRHQQALKDVAAANPRTVVLGDSAAEISLKKGSADLRNTEDRMGNVLWRIFHGELDGYAAENVVLALGPSSLAPGDPVEKIAAGLNEIVEAIAFHQPTAAIYVVPETSDNLLNEVLGVYLHTDKATLLDSVRTLEKTLKK